METALAPAAAAVVPGGLGLELRLFSRGREPRRGEAILWSTGWVLLALAVVAAIALSGGPADEWTTVYLIERSLSLDNVFLLSLLLRYCPRELAPPVAPQTRSLVGTSSRSSRAPDGYSDGSDSADL